MHTLVVIVNYRTADLTIDCLRSLQGEIAAAGEEVSVIVTDNASGDGSPDRIEDAIRKTGWDGWARLMCLPRNGGFAYGNNQAIRVGLQSEAPPQYVWLLNPDTLVRPGALASLQQFLESRPRVGIVGSRLEDPDGTPQTSAFRFPSVASEIEGSLRLGLVTRLLDQHRLAPPPSDEAARTQWVAGASMLIRREVFESIGLMDEGYFMYYEEVDFCRRAADAGWECWYEPKSRVVHLVGQASGVTDRLQVNKRRPAYWFESRRRYFLAHLGRFRTLVADTCFMGGFGLWRLRRRLQGKPDRDPARFLGDFLSHSAWRRGFRA